MTSGRRDAAVLAAGSLVGGVLAYVFFALVIRALGPAPAAPVAVLWAWWGFAGAALTFPVQHWISRTAATAGGEGAVRGGISRVVSAVLVVSVAAGGLAWVARDRIFGPDGAAFAVLVLGVALGSGLLGLLRGVLSGRRRFGAVASSIVAENGVRCAVAAVLMLSGSDTPAYYGLALLAGYVVAALWPGAVLLRGSGSAVATRSLGFVSGAAGGQLFAQAALTGGPVLLAAIGGAPAEVTALFAGLALFRAPYTLALGLVSALTGRLTYLVEHRRWTVLGRLRRGLFVTTLLTIALGAGFGAWIGPATMEVVFGDGVRLAPGQTALVAGGTVIAMANLVLTLGLLARDRAGGLAACWAVGIPAGVTAHVLIGGDALTTTCWTFVVVEIVALILLLGLEARSDHSSRTADVP
ncbi:MAG: hypothetical protein WA966_16255 [Ornithinimicrobium sp.]